jgi:hypothetical protein
LLLVRGGVSNCIAQAGQCFRMHDGTFAQLLISTTSPTGDVLCMVSPFETVPSAPANGRYMDFRWLQRCAHFYLTNVTQIDRREHVVPLLGNAARQVGDIHPHYLVNSGRFYEKDKDKALKIYCSCPSTGCAGRAPRPSEGLGTKNVLPCLWYHLCVVMRIEGFGVMYVCTWLGQVHREAPGTSISDSDLYSQPHMTQTAQH